MAAGSLRRTRARLGAAVGLGLALVLFAQQFASATANPQLEAANDRLEQLATLFDTFDGVAQLTNALPLGDMNPADALNLTDVFVDDDPAHDDDDPAADDPVAVGESLKEMLGAADADD